MGRFRKPSTRTLAFAVAAAVLVLLLVNQLDSGPTTKSLTYRQFRTELSRDHVRKAAIDGDRHLVTGQLADGTKFSASYPSPLGEEVSKALDSPSIDLSAAPASTRSWYFSLLLDLLPMIFLFVMLGYFLRQIGGRGKMLGKSRGKVADKDRPTVKFTDVAGLDEAVEELAEIRDFLVEPARFRHLGARIPKGVLLFGPPGTGKTLLARAVAGEAGVPFFSISGSDFVEMYVGVGAARVRDLFKQARAAAPCIIFVDEIDAVGRHRGSGLGGGHDEREQTLNQLLVEMDGFDATTSIILMAATNRPDILDPALLRPGRFDRQVVVDQADVNGRKKILEVHARDKPLADGVDLGVIARRTPGFTGADLANLLNEAALLAARQGFDRIGHAQLEAAIERVLAGAERSRLITDAEKQVIAFHESGHALVAHALPGADPVHKISIIPRGRTLGYTLMLPDEERTIMRRSELTDELAVLLGGRAAEEFIFGDPTTGAQNDIERATAIARSMVTEHGMSDALGPVRLVDDDPSDALAATIDAEVRALIDTAYGNARAILLQNRGVLDALAAALIERETLDAEAAQAILLPTRGFERTVVLPGAARPAGAVAATDHVRSPGRPTNQ